MTDRTTEEAVMPAPLTAHLPARETHRLTRNTAVAGGVALLIAVGGYEVANTLAPDAHPTGTEAVTSAYVAPSATVLRDLRSSVSGQYGAAPSPPQPVHRRRAAGAGTPTPATREAMRALHRTIVALYGHPRHP